MIKNGNRYDYKGFLKVDSSKEIYQICDVRINKKEIILSVMVPTILQLVK